MTFIYPGASALQLKGKTLIVPVVSVANVAQLAVDLLIASLSFHRLAIIDPKYFIPISGGRDDGKGITTPLELYGKEDSDLVILQQRSPVLKSQKQAFVDAFYDYFHTAGLSAIIFLAGMDLSNRTDAQMMTPTYHFVPSKSGVTDSALGNLLKLPIPKYTSPVPQHPQGDAQETNVPFIPGGGLTRRFLSSLPSGWSVPTAALLQFVLEGDNREDAHLFAAVIAKVLEIDCSWKEPESWRVGLFGPRQDQSLYG